MLTPLAILNGTLEKEDRQYSSVSHFSSGINQWFLR
jgi:hypothetical protein